MPPVAGGGCSTLGGDFGPYMTELQRQGIWDRRAQLKRGLLCYSFWYTCRSFGHATLNRTAFSH